MNETQIKAKLATLSASDDDTKKLLYTTFPLSVIIEVPSDGK